MLSRAEQQQALGLDELSVLLARQAYLLDHENDVFRLGGPVDKTLRRSVSKPYFATSLTNAAYAVAISSDGKTLAASASVGTERRSLLVRDLAQHGQPPRALPAPTESHLYSLAFLQDGKSIIGGYDKGEVLLCNLDRAEEVPLTLGKNHAGVWSLAVSLDGRHMALGGRDADTAAIWDISGRNGAMRVTRCRPAIP